MTHEELSDYAQMAPLEWYRYNNSRGDMLTAQNNLRFYQHRVALEQVRIAWLQYAFSPRRPGTPAAADTNKRCVVCFKALADAALVVELWPCHKHGCHRDCWHKYPLNGCILCDFDAMF